jgi:hypothetical protein
MAHEAGGSGTFFVEQAHQALAHEHAQSSEGDPMSNAQASFFDVERACRLVTKVSENRDGRSVAEQLQTARAKDL